VKPPTDLDVIRSPTLIGDKYSPTRTAELSLQAKSGELSNYSWVFIALAEPFRLRLLAVSSEMSGLGIIFLARRAMTPPPPGPCYALCSVAKVRR
jgi:hypothetical protein